MIPRWKALFSLLCIGLFSYPYACAGEAVNSVDTAVGFYTESTIAHEGETYEARLLAYYPQEDEFLDMLKAWETPVMLPGYVPEGFEMSECRVGYEQFDDWEELLGPYLAKEPDLVENSGQQRTKTWVLPREVFQDFNQVVIIYENGAGKQYFVRIARTDKKTWLMSMLDGFEIYTQASQPDATASNKRYSVSDDYENGLFSITYEQGAWSQNYAIPIALLENIPPDELMETTLLYYEVSSKDLDTHILLDVMSGLTSQTK